MEEARGPVPGLALPLLLPARLPASDSKCCNNDCDSEKQDLECQAWTATDNIRSHKSNVLKLRVVNHKNAIQIAAYARAVERKESKLILLNAKNKAEAIAIAGPDYDEHHAVSFEEMASLDEQLRDTETGS